MNHLDVYYRALRDYRGLISENRDCASFRRALAQTNTENDEIVITRNICTVDEEWIEAIEKGLVFIEKAIKEERQFIYSNGEVMPIEKIKNVSKDSVRHLAKHSNLITKEQTGPDLIPDQLYSVEKLNDYAVYENRFLYMLLCYLQDFITIRYEKILEISNKYDGVLKLNKTVLFQNRKIVYAVDLHEESKDDKYLRANNPAKKTIDRIDLILKAVTSFLATPLMEIAGKAAKLKPPITKTNVLKMDNNFKGAVALYDFIVAYDKPGYSVESSTAHLEPFSEILANDLSEAGAMLSFLLYEHGLGLTETLKERFQAEEIKRKEALIAQRNEQLAMFKRKLANAEIGPEEYLLEMEKHVRLLQNENRQLASVRAQVEELLAIKEQNEAEIASLQYKNETLNQCIEEEREQHTLAIEALKVEYEAMLEKKDREHEADMLRFKNRMEEEMLRMKNRIEEETLQMKNRMEDERAQHAVALAALKAECETMLEEKDRKHEAEMIVLQNQIEEEREQQTLVFEAWKAENEAEMLKREEQCNARIESLEQEYTSNLDSVKEQMRSTEEQCNEELKATKALLSESEEKYEVLNREFEDLQVQYRICTARLKGKQWQKGEPFPEDAFVKKEDFDELEKDLEAFVNFYDDRWNKVKKSIRKKLLSYQALKGRNGDKKKPEK